MKKQAVLSTEEAIELIKTLKRKVIDQTYYIPNGKVDLNLKSFLITTNPLL